MRAIPNARFWTYANDGFVKLTLRPDQSLTWGWAARHEEGWSSEVCTWTHAGDRVTLERSEEGRDCDGRSGSDQLLACPLDRLATWETTLPEAPARVPTWEAVHETRFDATAEAANY